MHHLEFLPVILILLSAAVFIVAIFNKINISPVLGYFVSGSALGSYGLNIVNAHQTGGLAEIGVVFLLFAIGLELTFERLKAMRLHVFGFGTLQVVITSTIIGTVVYLLGSNIKIAMIIGGGLALSSTAIVLQVIAERGRQSTQVGRLSLSVLLMQDFAVVPLLVMVPLLAGDSDNVAHSIGAALLKAMLALISIFILGRLLLRPLFSMITNSNTAKSNELFITTTLLIALGSAWATDYFGLSLALGAFVAGLLVAETEFQHQAEESIMPFKSLFLGLFFMTVGMDINLELIMNKLQLVAALSLTLIAIKAAIIIGLCLVFKFNLGASIHAGLLLSQGGEFAFILFGLAAKKQIIDPELSQILLLVVTITMALTPLLSEIGNFIADKIDGKHRTKKHNIYREIADLENHVIIAGFGRVGRMVARVLGAEKVPYIAVDLSPDVAEQGQKEGFPVYQGEMSRLDTLKSVSIDLSSSLIVTIDNEITVQRIVKTVKTLVPDLPIVVRVKDMLKADELRKIGVSTVVPETYETGLQLGSEVLRSIGISEYEIARLKNKFRAGDYVKIKEIEGI